MSWNQPVPKYMLLVETSPRKNLETNGHELGIDAMTLPQHKLSTTNQHAYSSVSYLSVILPYPGRYNEETTIQNNKALYLEYCIAWKKI